MSEPEEETAGRHAAPDDDPKSDPPPTAEGGDHAAEDSDDGDSDQDDDTTAHGTRQPGADPEDAEEIEEDRQERLDPENRPDGVEVDNTDREFDPEKGMFTDNDDFDQAEAKFPALGEQGA